VGTWKGKLHLFASSIENAQESPGIDMSKPADHSTNAAHSSPSPAEEADVVESIVPFMPIVLPVAGGVLMFLLAFIAIYMA
jgi:hypothetical protein